MPPKVQNARGLRHKVVPAEEVPIASPAKKRGRPAKAHVDDAIQDATEPPRKRGRPAKTTTDDASELKKRGRDRKADAPALPVPTTTATPTKGRGRPKKDTEAAEEPSTAPRGRPRKEIVVEPAQTPRGRGRPPKATPAAVTPQLNLRKRNTLRTRLPPAKVPKVEPTPQPARRGRPPKKAAKIPVPKKAVNRRATEAAAAKPTNPAKSLAPRKMRGHTLRQIPDKLVAQVDQYLHDLMQAGSNLPHAGQDQEQEQEQEQGQGHNMEGEANVDGNDIMEPISASVGDRDQEEAAEDAGTESVHAQDDAADQYSESVADDLAQGETAPNASGDSEQYMQSELNEELAAPVDEEEDEIVVPAYQIDMSRVDHENAITDGQVLKDGEGYVHERLVASSTTITAQ